jgi:anti-sigma factor RsiW
LVALLAIAAAAAAVVFAACIAGKLFSVAAPSHDQLQEEESRRWAAIATRGRMRVKIKASIPCSTMQIAPRV